MKNRLIKTASFVILLGIFTCMLTIIPFAELKANFSLKGPSELRAGDSASVMIKVDGEGIFGIRAEISYDKNQLTYSSSSGALSKWKVEITEENGKLSIWAEENNDFKSPINSSVTLIKLNFKASDKLKENDKVTVSLKVLEASSTADSIENISATYSIKVSKPYSSNCDLSSLSVEGYDLTPEFSADVTEYSIEGEVAFTQAPVKINAKTADSEASVDISGSRLSVGDNTVKIKVTAEDGKTAKTYTIKAVMAQDPDYVPSSDSSLSEISLSEGKLSPIFSTNIYDYIVYVPYETVSVSVSASASDSRSVSPESVDIELIEGENIITLPCTAEDGTESVYTVHIMRMPSYYTYETDTGTDTETDTDVAETGDTTEVITSEPSETEKETKNIIETTETALDVSENSDTNSEPESTADNVNVDDGISDMKFPLWALFAAAAVGLVLGGGVSILVFNFSNERK